MVLADTRCTAG